ncbi:BaiN/RdsA family NAD(P)/FAD-dependent oxidoreductase [Xylanivirga thermophila]|uniref:NAD(P)/FAD-dependent oxidoreductase n=1 Tax=Xylanivirga thermophila TaxID=2496273 RepID=UPI00101D0BA1
MMAAATAAKRGLDVVLIEKNKRLGIKLSITGKGRCNITNYTDIQGLISNIPVNGKFLYSAFNTLSNDDVISFFDERGVKTKVERGNRVFPVSDKAKDVVSALTNELKRSGVQLVYDEVVEVVSKDGVIKGVMLKAGGYISCNSVVIATGGLSYPQTGSTGDGYRFAEKNGHKIVTPKPSLVPLETYESWPKDAQGLALKNVSISVLNKIGKKVYGDFGEMLFTHFGISGPIVLSASSYMRDTKGEGYTVLIDLKPALTSEQLDRRIQRDFEKYSRKIFSNGLDDLLPKKLIPVIIELSGVPSDKPINQITKAERLGLVELLKELKLNIKGYRPIKEAIITSGGVDVQEIDPRTMESKLVDGLFFAGEVIDVDGYTGGFNLQIAFSTGYLAGLYC